MYSAQSYAYADTLLKTNSAMLHLLYYAMWSQRDKHTRVDPRTLFVIFKLTNTVGGKYPAMTYCSFFYFF